MSNYNVSLNPKKFSILIKLISHASLCVADEDDYFMYLLHDCMNGGLSEKNFDDLEEDEYNKYYSDLTKTLSELELILKRSKSNFNSRMIL